jgi:hypothetical protein
VKGFTLTSVLAATTTAGILGAPVVSAESTTQTQSLGSQGQLVDGAVVQGWTISDFKPSSDVIPHRVAGTLWEATATDEAIRGPATPIVSNFNARTSDGQTYRALFGAATPQGVNPATIAQGQETSGKVYFDVIGATPDSVVYNAGGRDLLVWVQAPASTPSGETQSTSYPSQSYPDQSYPEAAAPAATAAEAPEGAAAAPAEVPLPEGRQGTPVSEGSQGTPLPPAEGTPIPPAPGAPVPASIPGTPQPAGSQGTPLPPAEGTPIPTTYTPVPTP